jgi:hypothetical protein
MKSEAAEFNSPGIKRRGTKTPHLATISPTPAKKGNNGLFKPCNAFLQMNKTANIAWHGKQV